MREALRDIETASMCGMECADHSDPKAVKALCCEKFTDALDSLVADLSATIKSFIPRITACGLLTVSRKLESMAQVDTLMKTKKYDNIMADQLENMPSDTRTITMLWYFHHTLIRFHLNYSRFFTHVLCFVAHAASGSLSSMVYPMMTFTIGLIARPHPPKSYWLFLITYSLIVVILKCAVSLRAFCPTDAAYEISANTCTVTLDDELSYMEWPFVLGFKPGQQGWILWRVIWDILICLSALNSRHHLRSVGQWSRKPREMLNDLCQMQTEYDVTQKHRTDAQAKRPIFYDQFTEFAPDFDGLVRLMQQNWRIKLTKKGWEELENNELGYTQLTRQTCQPLCCSSETSLPLIGPLIGSIKYNDAVQDAYDSNYYEEDLYSAMLSYRFLSMIWMALFYPTFSAESIYNYRTDSSFIGVQTCMSMDVIEINYLMVLVIMFLHAVIDHILYLKRLTEYKMLLQMASVFGLHISLLTLFKMQADAPPVRVFMLGVWYVFECGYLYKSARQIHAHFPEDTQSDQFFSMNEFQTKPKAGGQKYAPGELVRSIQLMPTRLTYYSYMIVSMIPFVWELRCILNWYSCDTTLDLIEFIRLYDLHGTMFSVAYLRNIENTIDKRYVGELQLWWYKAAAGLLSFLGLWLIIWYVCASPLQRNLLNSCLQGTTVYL